MEHQARVVTVLEALSEKYSEENCIADGFEHIQLTSKQKKELRSSGLFPDKQCQVVALDGCGITSAGKAGEIGEICPEISELNLGNNKIQDWNEVFCILRQLKKLRSLNLCGNKLNDSSFSPLLFFNNSGTHVFNGLMELVLNNTKVSLEIVEQLLKFLPSVEELHLSLNGYSSVPKSNESFDNVKRLHLNGNAMKQWEEVENLSKLFPNLVSLVIMENPLENIEREQESSSFDYLTELCLTNTKLNSWDDVDAVRNFKSLKKLKLIGIPLVLDYKEEKARELILARLPNIEYLNGSRVTGSERESSERNFIREYHNDENPPKRYHELVAVHGKLTKLADVNLDPVDFADVLMYITGHTPYVQSISTRQTVSDFKKYFSNMLDVPVKKLFICLKDMEINFAPERLVYNKRKLSSYNVKDGDEIYVDILD